MELALGTFLLLSLALNIIMANALINRGKDPKQLEAVKKDLKKLYNEIEKFNKKYSGFFSKGD